MVREVLNRIESYTKPLAAVGASIGVLALGGGAIEYINARGPLDRASSLSTRSRQLLAADASSANIGDNVTAGQLGESANSDIEKSDKLESLGESKTLYALLLGIGGVITEGGVAILLSKKSNFSRANSRPNVPLSLADSTLSPSPTRPK